MCYLLFVAVLSRLFSTVTQISNSGGGGGGGGVTTPGNSIKDLFKVLITLINTI